MAEAELHTWLAEPLTADVRRALKRLQRCRHVEAIAVMPDVHLAKEVCVGVAVATRDALIPAAVGGDIGCGMASLALDADASLLREPDAAATLLDALYGAVPILRRRRRQGVALPDALARRSLSTEEIERSKRRDGALQFGTLGRGNHFVEFQRDGNRRLWVTVHSGSRGMGQAIRQAHEQRGMVDPTGLVVLDASSSAGAAYRADVAWALDYAEASRDRILDEIRTIMRAQFKIDADDDTIIRCHHNSVSLEMDGERARWIHRKGAISARTGQAGIIPGSMGTASFHVEGRGRPEALYSSSHGAGRTMSRTAARARITAAQLKGTMRGIWFDHRAAARLVEEAPGAYKDIHRVMRAQRALTKICRRLAPVLSFKGS
ncbi:MAG: RtcB family protein [Myxococcota bacterium]